MKIIQIGSNKGGDSLSDHLFKHYTHLEFAVFVEPNKMHIAELTQHYKQYSNAIIENVAIKPNFNTSKELTLYYHVDDGPQYEVTSCKVEHIQKHYWDTKNKIKSFTIPCLSLEELFEKHKVTALDWLLLDVEGIDVDILLSYNWSSIVIKRVEFEFIHLAEHAQKIKDMFLSLGYKEVPALHKFDWAFELV